MKLTEIEKKEMLEDAKDKKRREAFRKIKAPFHHKTFEEYINWLEEMQTVFQIKEERKIVNYKNVKI